MKKWKIILSGAITYTLISLLFWKILFNQYDTQILVQTIVSALVFSFLFFTLGPRLLKKTGEVLWETIPEVELLADEKLVLEGGASHFRGVEAVGGKLILTNKRLIFRSHHFNIQNHREEFLLEQIRSVMQDEQNRRIFKLQLADQTIHKFLVDLPMEWVHAIAR
jgi:hypothetical protein